MFMHKSKKGFTIVELVIVIAVIAILAAVLIPTFSNLVKKANMSADQQAVRQMNTALAADGAVVPTDIFKLHEVLSELGLSSEDYKPLTKDTYFFWDADLNRVLHVDDQYVVITPADYEGQAYTDKSNWFSLSLEIKEEKVTITDNKATVTNGAQMKYLLNKMNEGTKTLEITLDGTIDMMGAAFDLPQFNYNDGYNVTISGGTIKNAVTVDYAQEAVSGEDGQDGVYACALIPHVHCGNSVTISGVTFENLNIKNTNASGVGLLIGELSGGTATIEDVTIRNSTVIGHRNTGALVGTINYGSDSNGSGGAGGKLTLKGDIVLENVAVQTVGGRSGMLVGMLGAYGEVTATSAKIKLTNCAYELYKCEQNTGTAKVYDEDTKTYKTENLGLQSNGIVKSYALAQGEGDYAGQYVNQLEGKKFVENSLIMISNEEAKTSANDFYGATVTGW